MGSDVSVGKSGVATGEEGDEFEGDGGNEAEEAGREQGETGSMDFMKFGDREVDAEADDVDYDYNDGGGVDDGTG